MRGIPLAWLQLTHEKLRLFAALAGIAFAVILMLMQLGLMAALFDAAVLIYERFKSELVLVSPQFEYIVAPKGFPRQRLYQAMAAEEVVGVSPVFFSMASWKNPVDHEETSLLVVGFDPWADAFDLPGMEEEVAALAAPDVVLFDAASHPKFGPVAELVRENPRLTAEINRRRVRVGGVVRLGVGFASVGNVLTSEMGFLRLFPQRRQSQVDLGLVRLAPGADVPKVQQQLQVALPDDVRVLTRDQFMRLEKDFWRSVSPVGFIFGMGVLMGFVVGCVIVYQILYTDVSDHLAEYATLKAMGHSDRSLFGVVLQEALLLAILGYLPGLVISQGMYVVAARSTGLPITMSLERVVLVFLFTVVMCCVSAVLAMRRIRSADPAEIF